MGHILTIAELRNRVYDFVISDDRQNVTMRPRYSMYRNRRWRTNYWDIYHTMTQVSQPIREEFGSLYRGRVIWNVHLRHLDLFLLEFAMKDAYRLVGGIASALDKVPWRKITMDVLRLFEFFFNDNGFNIMPELEWHCTVFNTYMLQQLVSRDEIKTMVMKGVVTSIKLVRHAPVRNQVYTVSAGVAAQMRSELCISISASVYDFMSREEILVLIQSLEQYQTVASGLSVVIET
jgi:hypothetical protein